MTVEPEKEVKKISSASFESSYEYVNIDENKPRTRANSTLSEMESEVEDIIEKKRKKSSKDKKESKKSKK